VSPINDGQEVLRFAQRSLARNAKDGIDGAVRAVIHQHKQAEAEVRAQTDYDYATWHERFARFTTAPEGSSLHASEHAARLLHGIPHLTVTPVDRWMERLRRPQGETPWPIRTP
jgi:hypothetical protein